MSSSHEDPYTDVDLIEEALALALKVPKFPPKRSRVHAKPELGPEFRALVALFDERGREFTDLARKYHPKGGELDMVLLQQFDRWAGTADHFPKRMELIETLIAMRHANLEKLRALPEPDERGHFARYYIAGFRPEVPPWKDLDDSRQRILRVIAAGRKSAKEIRQQVGGSYDVVRRVIAELVNRGLAKRVGTSGYVIARVPFGAPPEIAAAADGKAVS